jgi:Conserved protein containing a Zn-ribbon-like motif, possibly RNA-binding
MTDPAELLRDFVNTYDVEKDADELASPAALTSWLHARGLIGAGDQATGDDLAAAVTLREGLRAALRRNHERAAARNHPPPAAQPPPRPATGLPAGTPPSPAEICTGARRRAGRPAVPPPPGPTDYLTTLLATLPVRISLDGPAPRLEPVVGGVRGGLTRLAAAVIDAHAAGTWPRLKVCVEDTCQWAFIDSSKNRSRSWCSMRICGNRTKTRAYRARNRAAGAAGRS